MTLLFNALSHIDLLTKNSHLKAKYVLSLLRIEICNRWTFCVNLAPGYVTKEAGKFSFSLMRYG